MGQIDKFNERQKDKQRETESSQRFECSSVVNLVTDFNDYRLSLSL